jgi:pimeloyl-ACP methyl ester carboxylesterase
VRFLRSQFGAVLLLLLLAVAGCCALAYYRVDRVTRPPRQDQVAVDFESMLMRVEEVRFPSADGVELAGWLLRGDPSQPAIILCHDNGESKSALVNLAIELRAAGFNLLLFDFRGHGDSDDERSTMGLHEKRDIFGAVDFLAERSGDQTRRLGVYGVGTGAHAAVLAALDRPNLKVLVLDRLYPDVSYPLARTVYRDWRFASRHLSFLPSGIFAVLSGVSAGSQRAAEAMEHLVGRDLLLLAPEADPELSSEMRRMYERIPEQIDADGNLVFLPATQGAGLYGELQARYQERVTDFFLTRLGHGADGERAGLEADAPPDGEGG